MTNQRIVNDEYLAMFQTPARYYYNIGGRWSAKTWETLSYNLTELLKHPGVRITIMRKVYDSIRNSIFEDCIEVLEHFGLQRDVHFSSTTTPLYIKFYNGSDIIFKGADRPDKLKGIAGSHILIMEELNEFIQDDFETVSFSMRGKGYPLKTFMMHNPVPIVPGMTYWFTKFFDPGNLEPGKPVIYTREGMGRVCAMKSTYKHNLFCPEDERERLEGLKITNPLKYKLWALGEYAELEGVILTNWDVVDRVPDNIDFLGYGLDFGFSVDPAACLKIWGTREELWIQGMLYYTGLTNIDLYEKMVDKNIKEYDKIIADSAEPKSIEDLYRYGFRGIRGVKKRANYKADMANVLRSYKIHLIAGDIDLQREIATWSWDIDKNRKYLPRPADGNDHYCLSGETKVLTVDGYKDIKELVGKTGQVITRNGIYEFNNVQQTGVEKTITIITEDGTEITCTEDHLFLTENGWIKAIELEGEELILHESNKTNKKQIAGTSIQYER